MKKIDRILLAVDLTPGQEQLSPGTRSAVFQARSLAPRLGAEITVLHATASDEAWDPTQSDYVVVPEGLPDRGRVTLEALVRELREAGIPSQLVLSEERAWLAILRHVLRHRIGLVIAGKRGHLEQSARPVGSVSMKLLHNCPSPVWVTRPGSEARLRRILAATDLSPAGERALDHAAFLARHYEAELHVVHAFQIPLSVQMEGAEESYSVRERQSLMDVLRKQLEAAGHGVRASFHVGVTAPTRAILRTTQQVSPDLVVMGSVSRGGIAGFLVGNTAERLIDRLDCSLLTVKPDDFICPVTLE